MSEVNQSLEMNEDLEKAKRFVRANLIETVDNKRFACSDDRFKSEQSRGAVRIFGGDFGVLSAVIEAAKNAGLNNTVQNIFGRYLDFLARPSHERDPHLYIHTDTHSHGGIGCGHIKNIVEKMPWGKELFDLFTSKKDSGLVDETVLEGPHNAKGIILVNSTDKSVNSVDQTTGEQYFVVDMERAKEYLMSLPERLALLNIPKEEIWKAYQRQMTDTAIEIAAGAKQFNVSFVPMSTEPQVTAADPVPSA